ncbi:MAG: hypothetical protein GYA87_04830 [Christensenellaceae bacterium]|nr:hypothetical protein [Christensenellaceae bacterium]
MKNIFTKKLLLIFLCFILLSPKVLAEPFKKIKPIFSYECTCNIGELGKEGGFILMLYENGFIKHSPLLVGESIPLYTDSYIIDKKYVDEISAIIDNAKLEDVPTVLYNGSEDGITNNIGLKGTYYLASNIVYTDDENLEALKLGEKQNAIYENRIVAVFEDIQKVFENAGFLLSFEHFIKIED